MERKEIQKLIAQVQNPFLLDLIYNLVKEMIEYYER